MYRIGSIVLSLSSFAAVGAAGLGHEPDDPPAEGASPSEAVSSPAGETTEVSVPLRDYATAAGLQGRTGNRMVNSFGRPCVADLGRDGIDDVVWSNHWRQPWDVFRGCRGGGFVPWPGNTFPAVDNHGCAVADFTGDSTTDAVIRIDVAMVLVIHEIRGTVRRVQGEVR